MLTVPWNELQVVSNYISVLASFFIILHKGSIYFSGKIVKTSTTWKTQFWVHRLNVMGKKKKADEVRVKVVEEYIGIEREDTQETVENFKKTCPHQILLG